MNGIKINRKTEIWSWRELLGTNIFCTDKIPRINIMPTRWLTLTSLVLKAINKIIENKIICKIETKFGCIKLITGDILIIRANIDAM